MNPLPTARGTGSAAVEPHLEVVDEVDLGLPAHLHLAHGHGARVDAVDDLAVDGTGRQVLDLGKVWLEVLLDPRDELLASDKVALRPRGMNRADAIERVSTRRARLQAPRAVPTPASLLCVAAPSAPAACAPRACRVGSERCARRAASLSRHSRSQAPHAPRSSSPWPPWVLCSLAALLVSP